MKFAQNERGSIAVMAAFLIPVLMIATLGSSTVIVAFAKKKELTSIAQTVCNRAVKPLRMVEQNDSDRQKRAKTLFDELTAERGFVFKTPPEVKVGWLEATVVAEATIPIVSGFGDQIALTAKVNEVCRGVPPYPKLQEEVLSSNFKTPDGTSVSLPNLKCGGKWGVFPPASLGWDGGTGLGIEIQDWSNGFAVGAGCSVVSRLPAGVGNNYVVELDSGKLPGGATPPTSTCGVKGPAANSSMFKNFELHPGTYRLSMWNRARVLASEVVENPPPPPNTGTSNKIVVYLEGTQPVKKKEAVITWDDYDTAWSKRFYDFTVDSYGLYRLHVAAEGCSDGSGGLFNDLKLTYIKRPYPEYNDPNPSN